MPRKSNTKTHCTAMTIKSCIKSMRLRTLPLSLAGVIAGIHIAGAACSLSLPTVIALVMTTVFLQILSNLSNELGDTLHGTDTDERQGMHYSLQDGEMTLQQMKAFIAAIVVLCCLSGLTMIYFSFGTLVSLQSLAFTVLGAAAIWAAMHYTLGENPYGYRGYGDIFVFIFFGLVACLGSAYICSHSFSLIWILPASAFGLWSVAVLNVNNIRDMATDEATRTTVAIKLGAKKARIYHTVLISAAWCLMLAYSIVTADSIKDFLYVIMFPLSILHLKEVWTRTGKSLDPMLPMLVMTTFAVALLFLLS